MKRLVVAMQANRQAVLIAVCTLCMCGYWLITHHSIGIFGGLGDDAARLGDLNQYLTRLASITVLLCIIPAAVARMVGYRFAMLGVSKPHIDARTLNIGLIGVAVIVVGSFTASQNPAMQLFYPFSKQIAAHIAEHRVYIVWYAMVYGIFYYIPWEFFFRGVLMFPFVGANDKWYGMGCCIQVIPSTLLHFGHPAVELFGAIPFGFFAAYLTWKTKSIIPALVVHTIAGVVLDSFLIFN